MNNKDYITVHQAFYGEANHSHSCIYTTLEDAELKTFLTGFTDRPGSLPVGVTLEPYFSAVAHEKYYIFTITFPDSNANRSGMVFTHVLITELVSLEHIDNLHTLFNIFIQKIPQEKVLLQALQIPISTLKSTDNPSSFEAYIPKGLTKLATSNPPLLFCGESSSFLKFIAAIWPGLPFLLRKAMSYTAGFSTLNLDTSRTVLHFQKSLQQLLKTQDYISDDIKEPAESLSSIEKHILTPTAGKEFDSFIKELDINLDNWNLLQLSAKAYDAYQDFERLSNDALKQLLRQIAKISPVHGSRKEIKEKVLKQLEQRLAAGTENNLKSLKNLPLAAYEKGEDIIGASMEELIETEFSKDNEFDMELMAEIAILLLNDNRQTWWDRSAKKAFNRIFKKQGKPETQNTWKLLTKSEESLKAVLPLIPEDKSFENSLIKDMPGEIQKDIAKLFATSIQQRKWLMLHSYLLQRYLPAKEAVKQQLMLEKRLAADFKGSELILKRVSDTDVLSVVIETKENFFIEEYAKRSINDATLLNALDINEPTWLQIWAFSLKETKSLQHGILNLAAKIELLLNNVALGTKVPYEIIKEIAATEFADIKDLKNRHELWKHLQPDEKILFLKATINGITKEISSKGLDATAIEPEVASYISSDDYMTSLLGQYRDDIDTVLEVYTHIPGLKDSFLADYIRYFSKNLNAMQSARLGDLILSHGFHRSAWQVFEKAKQNNSFKIALTKCYSIAGLSLWDKFRWGGLIGKIVSDDLAYMALADIAVKLYSKGPEHNDIWERAGGELGKLHNDKTREENWQSAINMLKNGGGGKKLSTKALIKEMMEDYPSNTQLGEILKHFKHS